MKDFTLATCSFNTPEITLNMLLSFEHYNKGHQILISDNSTNEITAELLNKYRYHFYVNSGFHHSIGVDFLLDVCPTRYMLLVDTDVIFHCSVDSILDRFINSSSCIGGVVQGSRGGRNLYDRVCPWFCMIDVEKVRDSNIKYYDTKRFTQHLKVTTDKVYDVGATFYEDILNNGHTIFTIGEEEQNIYITHFEGMSWRKDSNNARLIQMANEVEIQYNNIIQGCIWHGKV